ncbi:MAG TPA: class I SAM-dependent methyltransferase [Actinomycetota bacterium]|nr:class I SAM-dependent methyltransferase [Actinomycetota bacterium]
MNLHSQSPTHLPADTDSLVPQLMRKAEQFDAMYETTPPWDIGRPQAAFLDLLMAGRITGKVLDVGCGTGEHALMAADAGLEAVGIDAAPRAIATANQKAEARGLAARFIVGDALELDRMHETFDTVLDCGLFHIFPDDDRVRFAEALQAVVPPGGRYFMLCFSEHQPGELGPRRVKREEIAGCFSRGWSVESIEPSTIELLGGAAAISWMAAIGRVD